MSWLILVYTNMNCMPNIWTSVSLLNYFPAFTENHPLITYPGDIEKMSDNCAIDRLSSVLRTTKSR